MTFYQNMLEASSRWIDKVAATILLARDLLRPRPVYKLVEQEDGNFELIETLPDGQSVMGGSSFRFRNGRLEASRMDELQQKLRGAKIELVLRPIHFLFRPLELPRRALEFLEGIIRAQIDRLTPWTPAEAAFGWQPSTINTLGDRIEVMVAATARNKIAPFISALSAAGADSVRILASMPNENENSLAIPVLAQKASALADLAQIRRWLVTLAVGGSALASLAILANGTLGAMLEARRDDLTSAISAAHAALKPGGGGIGEAVKELERRKHEIPSSALVIEALSRILPDDTYLTELRILGDKVQIIGLTQDAPALIRIIEQNAHFSKATFFAPTTRTASEQSEHFHIEAHIEPVFTPGP